LVLGGLFGSFPREAPVLPRHQAKGHTMPVEGPNAAGPVDLNDPVLLQLITEGFASSIGMQIMTEQMAEQKEDDPEEE
jgi:hypothetical protein